MPLTAILADDEPLLRAQLRDKLSVLWPDLSIVGEAENGIEASSLIESLQPTIAFLDIKMPGRTGIEVAQGIESPTRVVFVTAYDQYAVQAFENEALDYVLKPISDERLGKTIKRVRAAVESSGPLPDIAQLLHALQRNNSPEAPRLRWIRASKGDTTFQIAVDEVVLFQSDDKYTVVYTKDSEYLISKPLSELIQQLDPEHFWQVHRGSVVNVRTVIASKREGEAKVSLVLRGHAKPVVVSRAYQHLFRQM